MVSYPANISIGQEIYEKSRENETFIRGDWIKDKYTFGSEDGGVNE